MPKKKSLADELADLFNPAPTKEFDPEADVFGAGPALEDSDDELAAAAGGRRKGKEASRLRGDIVMDGREYAGRRTSRAALFDGEAASEEEGGSGSDDDDAVESGSGSGSEEGMEEAGSGSGGEGEEDGGHPPANGHAAAGSSGDEELEGSSGEEEDGADGWLGGGGDGGSDEEAPEEEAAGSGAAARRAARAKAAAAGSDGEEAAGGSSDEKGGGRGGAASAAAAAEDDEMAALEREYEAMQQDEAAAMAGLKERAAKERRKALAVQAQKAVWQRGLEARILLQRSLAAANRLPQGEMQAVAAASSPDIAAAFTGLAADAAALAGDLLHLLGALRAQNPAVAAAAGATGAGGAAAPAAPAAAAGGGEEAAEAASGEAPATPDALWERVEAGYASFAPFRDASIDRWHRKTMLTAGGATLRGGQLRALNQSVSTQVAQLLQDTGKVLQRTRLPRSAQQQPQQRLLCPDPDQPAAKRRRLGDESEEDVDGTLEEERDPETFDDTEFYQTLLREFLEGSTDAGGANWHTVIAHVADRIDLSKEINSVRQELSKEISGVQGPKQRKAVDRRASKGRKLRYHVHDKLVNFMAPVDLAAPQYAAQLFSNLFGGGAARGNLIAVTAPALLNVLGTRSFATSLWNLRPQSYSTIADLKSQASSLHERLSDLHSRFHKSQAVQLQQTSSLAADEWHRLWHMQVKELSVAQLMLRSKGVAVQRAAKGAAAALQAVERTAGQLEGSLSGV